MRFSDLPLRRMEAFAKIDISIYSRSPMYYWAQERLRKAHNMLFTVAQGYVTHAELFNALVAIPKDQPKKNALSHPNVFYSSGRPAQKPFKTLRAHRMGYSHIPALTA